MDHSSPSPLMSPSSSGVSGSGGPGFSSSEEQPNQGPTLKAMIAKKANFFIFYMFSDFIVFVVNGSLWPYQGPNKPFKFGEIKDFRPFGSQHLTMIAWDSRPMRVFFG